MTVKVNCLTRKITHKADKKEYGEVWFDEQVITNISEMNNFKRKFRVKYDSNTDWSFTAHKANSEVIHFNMHKDGLHYHDTKNHNVAIVQTICENEAG